MIMAEPHPIQESQLKRFATAAYSEDVPIRMIRQMASELLSLRQQIGQRQAELEFIMQKNMQEPKQEPAQAVPYAWHVPPMSRMYFGEYAQLDAEAEAKRVGGTAKAIPLYTHPAPLESKQAVPVGRVMYWQGEPGLAPATCIRGFAEYPKGYAQLGPWREGEPVYTHPAPLDSDTRKMVLELCDMADHYALIVQPYVPNWLDSDEKLKEQAEGIEQHAKQIRERLEAGDGKN